MTKPRGAPHPPRLDVTHRAPGSLVLPDGAQKTTKKGNAIHCVGDMRPKPEGTITWPGWLFSRHSLMQDASNSHPYEGCRYGRALLGSA